MLRKAKEEILHLFQKKEKIEENVVKRVLFQLVR